MYERKDCKLRIFTYLNRKSYLECPFVSRSNMEVDCNAEREVTASLLD
jgi:hypothetical protein